MKRHVQIKISQQDNLPPFTLGIFRPVICIPGYALTSLDDAELEAVIAHEMTHIARLDDLWLSALQFLKCVFFFNPVLSAIQRQILHQCERICDRKVIQAQHFPAKQYASSLIMVVIASNNHAIPAAAMSHEFQDLRSRIADISSTPARNQTRSFVQIVAIFVTGLLLLPMQSPGRGTQEDQEPVFADFQMGMPESLKVLTYGFGLSYSDLEWHEGTAEWTSQAIFGDFIIMRSAPEDTGGGYEVVRFSRLVAPNEDTKPR